MLKDSSPISSSPGSSALATNPSVPLTPLQQILACPRCHGTLSFSTLESVPGESSGAKSSADPNTSDAGNAPNCNNCRQNFVKLGPLLCLYPQAQASLMDWRNRWHLAMHQLALDEQASKRALASAQQPTGSKTKRKASIERLRRLVNGYQQQQQWLRKLLRQLSSFEANEHAALLALKTRLPSHHGLLSYQANVFRDWVWGTQENQATCEALTTAYHAGSLPTDGARPRIAVLGAGAGRLTADLHRELNAELTVAIDSNPYLGLIATAQWQGQPVQLVEFPLAPKSLSDVAVNQALDGCQTQPGLHYLLADAMHAPLACSSFDVVVTPWFTDIVDAGAEQLVAHINRLLKPGGLWLNTGSMAFAHADPLSCHSFEELTQCAAAEGFVQQFHNEQQVPYLASPHSRHQRLETLCTTRWQKVQDSANTQPYQELPAWLEQGNLAIPAIDALTLQASTTRIHAFIMALIDGQRSVNDIAKVLEEQKLMAAQDAEVALRGFLLKMLEEAAAKASR